jgi:uncharacterized repeat protein (TIGR03803 family)
MKRFGFFSQVQINERTGIGLLRSLTLILLLSLSFFVAQAGAQKQSHNFQLPGSSNINSSEGQAGDGEHMHSLLSYSTTPFLDFTFCTAPQISSNGGCFGLNPQSGVTFGPPISPFPNYIFGTNLSGNVSQYCPIPGGTSPEHTVQLEPGGEVYELDPSGGWEVLHIFNAFSEPSNTDGFYPVGGLVFDGSYNLWGTTCSGGVYGSGIVFELTPPPVTSPSGPWTYTYYSFGSQSNDGANPVASLFYDSVNNVLWGTTENGGANGFGTIFEITNPGAGPSSESPMYSFQGAPTDGAYPLGGIVEDPYAAGLYYGTTQQGGAVQSGNGYGTLFQYIPSSNHPTKLLHSFAGTDGANPAAGVIAIQDPTITNQTDIYGTTEYGGQFNSGLVFAATQGSWGGLVYAFGTNPNDGVNPVSGLIALNDPSNPANIYLYGTTMAGSLSDCNLTYGCGTVFGLQSTPTWNESQLIPFCSNYNQPCGVSPLAGLTADQTGNLWGTTEYGGDAGAGYYGAGTVFELYCSGLSCPPHFLSKFLKWDDVGVGEIGTAMSAKFLNSSDQPVQIGEIVVTGDFTLGKVKSGACSGILAAGATCVVAAIFKPQQSGHLTGGLAITLSGQESPVTLFLTGTGLK